MRREFRMQMFGITITTLILLVLVGCTTNSKAKTESAFVEQTTVDTYEQSSELEVTFNELEVREKILTSYPENGEFIIVKIMLKNNQEDTIFAKMEDIKLISVDGIEHTYSIDGQMAWYSEIDSIMDPFRFSLIKGIGQELDMVFDVPQGYRKGDLRIMTLSSLPYSEMNLVN